MSQCCRSHKIHTCIVETANVPRVNETKNHRLAIVILIICVSFSCVSSVITLVFDICYFLFLVHEKPCQTSSFMEVQFIIHRYSPTFKTLLNLYKYADLIWFDAKINSLHFEILLDLCNTLVRLVLHL